MSEPELKRIWLYHTTDDRYKAHPSPCWLRPGQEFVVKNWTGDTVEVDLREPFSRKTHKQIG